LSGWRGDCLDTIASETVDTVITSPPYLNAIDYLRGHRLSLVWFGYQLGQLRTVRAESIGTERAPDRTADLRRAREIISELELIERLPPRILRMIERYLHDLSLMIAEIHRVLRPSGRAILVIGNSSIRGVFVENARALVRIAEQAGLRLVNVVERELPPARRYLPPPVSSQHAALLKRMRTETVLSYVRDQPVLSDVRRCDASR
jgi:DNA modification methylase